MRELGYRLSVEGKLFSAGASGGGGGGGIPSSVTHFVLPADMSFNGSNQLTGIVDRVAASSAYIAAQGTMTGDSTDGLIYTEATGLSQWMRLDGLFPEADPAPHLMLAIQRNGTADDASMVLFGGTSDFYTGQNGSASSAGGGSQFSYTDQWLNGLLIDGRGVPAVATRDQVWDNVFADTEISTVGFEGLTSSNSNVGLLTYNSGANFIFEGRLRGWAVFTDWSQHEAVSTALKGT